MSVRLPPHSHCLNCEEPVPEGEQYCSEKCMVESKVKQKQSSVRNKLFYVIAAVALVLLWLFTFVL
ncbi:MAG: DUF2116 family Zn-ribbon domain-containing protein [Methanomassiliicoccus sp.]|nr:DUF2116 family Zn-ribbon domain-containing protein [Methanomassiliicoccus sp.]